jgi:predicted phosphodiesterase
MARFSGALATTAGGTSDLRLWIMSDLHIELTRGWDLPAVGSRPDYDVLIVAGDLIPRMERGVAWLLARVTDRPVIYVGGNHEGYGTDLGRTLEKARAAAAGTNVHVLERDSIEINGVTFFGATGWTDFNLFGHRERAMRAAAEVMNDYRKIRTGGAYQYRLRPAHTLAIHMETRAYLQRELGKPRTGRRVVVTHHGFHGVQSVRRGHEQDLASAAYASDAAIEGADLWVYGHTHETKDFMVGNGMVGNGGCTRVVSNQKGYGPWAAGETWENPDFNPHFVIEI